MYLILIANIVIICQAKHPWQSKLEKCTYLRTVWYYVPVSRITINRKSIQMKVLVVGGGNMGLTYVRSFLKSHLVPMEHLTILEKSAKKAEEISKLNIGTVTITPGSYVSEADLVILAVKPQDISKVYEGLRQYIDPEQLILSIMAGISVASISEGLGTTKVVRAMPNMPAQVGMGMTVFYSADSVTRIELIMIQNLLSSTGKAVYADSEAAIDSATALSGSGPAYVFYFMQSMIDSAKEMGYSQAQAELLTYQTFKGAVELYNKHDLSCQEWIEKVSSRGGTTEAAFHIFDSEQIAKRYQKAIEAARLRAVELSKA